MYSYFDAYDVGYKQGYADAYEYITKCLKAEMAYEYNEKIDHYRNLAHTYKVEMNRYRRKLTRIYKLFKLAYREAVLQHVTRGIPKVYIDAVANLIKEVKNV